MLGAWSPSKAFLRAVPKWPTCSLQHVFMTSDSMRGHALITVAMTLLLACGKTVDSGDAQSTDAPDEPAAQFCTWKAADGGTIQCPADGKTPCLGPDGCAVCICNLDGTRGGCTTPPCP